MAYNGAYLGSGLDSALAGVGTGIAKISGSQWANKDLASAFIVFCGDSHTSGQAATDTGDDKVMALDPPAGVTDSFHARDNSSGTFCDQFARYLRSEYHVGIKNRVAQPQDLSYNTYTGAWGYGTNASADVYGDNSYYATLVIGDKVVKKLDTSFPQKVFRLYYRKLSIGGIVTVKFKYSSPGATSGLERKYSTFTLPSDITGVTRSDDATGTDMDTIDTYDATGSFNNLLSYTLPWPGYWECEITVTANGGGGQAGCYLQPHMLEVNQFINAGRGNHTTLDYIGETVTVGAGGSGDLDHTDHLGEVLALNPTHIILEPMIINDWFHGAHPVDTKNAIAEMIDRATAAGVDIVVLGTSPVITTSNEFDYSDNPNYATAPPLADDLNGLGTYAEYYSVVERVCAEKGIRFIDTYEYFQYRYRKSDHENWTLGTNAGRIHVNQHGHDVYYAALVRFSGIGRTQAI